MRSLELNTVYPLPFTTPDIACAFPNRRRLGMNDVIHMADDTLPTMGWPFLDFVSKRTLHFLGQMVRHMHFYTSPGLTRAVELTKAVFEQLFLVVLGCRADGCVLECMVASTPTVRFLQVFDSRPPREATESPEAFAQHIQELMVRHAPVITCAHT